MSTTHSRLLGASIALVLAIVVAPGARAQTVTGADPTGNSDSSAAFNSATANMENVYVLTIPPGKYRLDSPWVIDNYINNLTHNVKIVGYGVEFVPRSDAPTSQTVRNGDMSTIKIHFTTTPFQLTIEGITVNHLGNQYARSAFELLNSAHVNLIDTTVIAHSTGANYAAYWLHNDNPANPDTGTFWTTIDRCTIRKRSGNEGSAITTGIRLQGAANATNIRDCSITATINAIDIVAETGNSYLANGVVIDGNRIEGFGSYAIRVVGSNAQGSWRSASGLRITNNRIENGNAANTAFLRLAGGSGNEADPPVVAFNYLIGIPSIIENDAGRKVILFDAAEMTKASPPPIVRTDTLIPGR